MTVHYQATRLLDFARGMKLGRAHAANERLAPGALGALQQAELDALVRFAVAHSRFYADHYGGLDLRAPIDLARLPTVDKAMLTERWNDWVTDTRLRYTEVDAHVSKLEGDALYLGEYRACVTGGTSGRRGVFVFSRSDWVRAMAGFVRQTAFLGVAPRIPRWRVATVAAVHTLHMTARFSSFVDLGLHRVQRFDVRRSVGELAAGLDAFQPDFLLGYPSALALLADEQRAGRLRIRPRIVATTSETRTPEMEARIVAAWDRVPFDIYASTETAFLAMDCERHTGRHIFEDMIIVENVDAEGRPVPDGQPGNHLLVTNLWNATQPLIRYKLSDIAVVDSASCTCGRTFRRLVAIDGRSDDVLPLRDVHGREVPVHPLAVRSPFTAIAELKQYQVIYDDCSLLVRVVPAEGASGDVLEQRIRHALGRKLDELGVVPPPIAVDVVDALPRDPGHAGKLKLIEVRRTATPGGAAQSA
jgi:phenylacetate-CoA ligase